LLPYTTLFRSAGGLRVEAQEVDRLADLGVGVLPGLSGLAHDQGCEAPAPLGGEVGRMLQGRGPLLEGALRPLGLQGELQRPARLLLASPAKAGDGAIGPARIGGCHLFASLGLPAADHHRGAQRQLGVERRQRRGQLLSDLGPAQLEQGMVSKLVHPGGSKRSSSEWWRCWGRKPWFDEFSSRRRTRYAI